MPKFYVQCGSIEVVLLADRPESAALAALDRALQTHGWIYSDPRLNDQTRHDHLVLEALLHLDPQIRVSERGFERTDADQIGTPEIIHQWHALMTAINRLCTTVGFSPCWIGAESSGGNGANRRMTQRSPK